MANKPKKRKPSKFGHLRGIKTIGSVDVSHMTLKDRNKISKAQQKADKHNIKAEMQKTSTRKKMYKKYGTDTTSIMEHDARSKIDARDYAKRKFTDATAHVMKVSPYLNTVNSSVADIFGDEDVDK